MGLRKQFHAGLYCTSLAVIRDLILSEVMCCTRKSAETTSTILCLFIAPQVCPLYFISPWIELLLQDHVCIHSALALSVMK